MNTLIKTTINAVLVLVLNVTISFAHNADSLAYDSLRTHIASIDSEHTALSTADALAEAGLFGDAVAILREHALVDIASPDTGISNRQRLTQWRFSSGVDYYHLEDVDTVTMTSEELREYKRLTETPLSVWMRAKSRIKPQNEYVGEVTPEVYISERKSRLSVTARTSFLKDFLQLEPSIKTEKWFRDGASDTIFAPVKGQSSDMGGLAMLLTVSNPGSSQGSVAWSIPVAVDWEHYRKDLPGYESFIEYGISPTLEMRPAAASIGARISAQARYEDYYYTYSDILDVAHFIGRLEAFSRKEKHNVLLNMAWMTDWYTNATSPEVINRLEGSGRFEYKLTHILSGHLHLRGIHEREKHGPTLHSPVVTIHGSELIVEPTIETAIGAHIRIIPELLWERRWSGSRDIQSIWDARKAWESGMRFRWSSTILEASVRGAFRTENVDTQKNGAPVDSRSFLAEADANLNLNRRISANLFADYHYRVYTTARVSENISLSASVTIQL